MLASRLSRASTCVSSLPDSLNYPASQELTIRSRLHSTRCTTRFVSPSPSSPFHSRVVVLTLRPSQPDNDKYLELDFLRSWLLSHLSPSPASPSSATTPSADFDPTKPENVAAAAAGVTAAPTITVSEATPILGAGEEESRSKL